MIDEKFIKKFKIFRRFFLSFFLNKFLSLTGHTHKKQSKLLKICVCVQKRMDDEESAERMLKHSDEVVRRDATVALAAQRERLLNERVRAKNDAKKLFSEFDEENNVYFATDDPIKTMTFKSSDNKEG